MSDKFTISFSGKEVNCLGRNYSLGQLFIDFLELDLTEYEIARQKVLEVINSNDTDTMTEFTKITPRELKRGYRGLSYEELGISDESSLEQKYTVYAIYKALLKIDHKYLEILDYPSINNNRYDKILEVFDLVALQKSYKDAMEKCLMKDDLNTPSIQRLSEYGTALHGRAELMFRIYNNAMHEVFIASDISSLLYIEFMKMIQNDISVWICENCGKYFIIKGKYDMKYCEREVNGEKVCQKVGAVKSFKDKVKNNPVYNEYEKVYKRFYARKRKGLITQEQFDTWVKKSSKTKKEALKGNLSFGEFKTIISDI